MDPNASEFVVTRNYLDTIVSYSAQWRVENGNEVATQFADARFAGRMLPGGLFQPADAGPNPKRPYSTNNAGDLAVHASLQDGDRQVSASGRLIVTVQRWNDPPIR